MKRIATSFLLVACLALHGLAQSAPEQKKPDKDSDKKQAVPSSAKDKKKGATDEKKEDPKHGRLPRHVLRSILSVTGINWPDGNAGSLHSAPLRLRSGSLRSG